MNFLEKIKEDMAPSIVVFLVALPLCMGIAIASGVPPVRGLIAGMIGGLVVGTLAGCPLQVSGPAAGLAVLVYELVGEHGLAVLGIIVFLAGIVQLAAGALKLGRWFQAVSPAVIQGMLAGIGVLIFASQFHVMVDDKPKGNGIADLVSIPGAVYKGLIPADGSVHHLAAFIGVLTLVTLLAWERFKPERLKAVAGSLVAVVVATSVATIFSFPVTRVKIPGGMSDMVQFPTWEVFTSSMNWTIIGAAIAMAFIASAESLLCATAVDQLHTGPRTNYDKELRAQGVGNILCGLVGALPVTGVIVRSSANVAAGGKSRASAIMHGFWLLLFCLMLPFILEFIPTASLAAILVFIGYRLMNPKVVKNLKSYGNGELVIYLATVFFIVSANLLTGVLVGLGLSLAKLLYTFAYLEIEVRDRGNRVDLLLEGAATFLSLPKLANSLEQLPAGREVHLHFEHLHHVDHACLDFLTSYEKLYKEQGGTLVVEWTDLQIRYHPKKVSEMRRAS